MDLRPAVPHSAGKSKAAVPVNHPTALVMPCVGILDQDKGGPPLPRIAAVPAIASWGGWRRRWFSRSPGLLSAGTAKGPGMTRPCDAVLVKAGWPPLAEAAFPSAVLFAWPPFKWLTISEKTVPPQFVCFCCSERAYWDLVRYRNVTRGATRQYEKCGLTPWQSFRAIVPS
jgi:hypothetical protein